ncbi:MAG: hypothetical protein KDK99_04100 [Verrucomicrobiales bacterium]|nr:hypothetical protein [Verrucomicrobiales bacterium]
MIPSSWRSSLLISIITCTGCVATSPPSWSQAPATRLTAAQVDRIGQRIWQNECGGSVDGLTSWNQGEQFASLGIGHFIWYPAGARGPFEESFPPLARYLQSRGAALPGWLTPGMPCPWASRQAFLADHQGPRQRDLRVLLSRTVREQTEFIMQRSRQALPKMLAAAAPGRAAGVRQNYEALSATPEGMFALIDYVNFKGEGTNPAERYRGEGWGLLQVLEAMPPSAPAGAPAAFAEASAAILSRRVANSPPERGEQRWLAGWRARCARYRQPL